MPYLGCVSVKGTTKLTQLAWLSFAQVRELTKMSQAHFLLTEMQGHGTDLSPAHQIRDVTSTARIVGSPRTASPT